MFKQATGYDFKKLEEVTGFTRQGLHYAFNMLDQGRVPSRKFVTCINEAMEARIKDEENEMKRDNDRHESKLKKLKSIQTQINKFKKQTH